MTDPTDILLEARRIDELYRGKARAEVAAAEALVSGKNAVRGQGDLIAEVLLVKGAPGPGDIAVGRALAGDDGVAIGRALDALGLSAARYALCTRIGGAAKARIARLRALAEAVDPRIVVLLDTEAAQDFAAAFGVTAPEPGVVARVLGREVLALDGFEASLGDETAKRRVWRQLRALDRETQV